MKKQHGFTLIESVLVFVVVGVILATTIPTLLRIYSQEQQKKEIRTAVSQTLMSLQHALDAHIETTQCLTAPTINVNMLVNQYHLDTNVPHLLPSLTVTINALLIPPKLATNLSLTFTAKSDNDERMINEWLNNGERFITRHANRITLTLPVDPIHTQLGRMYFDPTTGCYQ